LSFSFVFFVFFEFFVYCRQPVQRDSELPAIISPRSAST